MVWPPVLQPLCMCWSREGGNLLCLSVFSGAAWETSACCSTEGWLVPGAGRAAQHRGVSLGTPLLHGLSRDTGEGSGEQRCANPHLFQFKTQCLHFLPGCILGSCLCCSCTLWRWSTLQECWTELHSSLLCRVAGLLAAD